MEISSLRSGFNGDVPVGIALDAHGVRITVNLGPTPFKTGTDLLVPGYGFRVRKVDGSTIDGQFRHALELDARPR